MIRCLLLGLLSIAVYAQSGMVKSAGKPIPGATVTASHGDAKMATVTDRAGHYTLPPLGPGAWTVEVTMYGFDAARREVSAPQATRELDFNLTLRRSPLAAAVAARSQAGNQVDSQIQNALSSAEAPAVPPPTTGGNEAFLVSGSLSQGVANGAAPDSGPARPAGGFAERADMQAGPAPTAPGFGGADGGGGFGGPRGFGGGPRGPGGFGGRVRGPGPGGGPRQFGNRRPPNQIRGMVFATLNNSALNAKPFSITGQDFPEPSYAQARFGVLLGGPLMIPKIVKDPSTFFFLSYFATRARNPFTAVETVPTAAERLGDFSAAPAVVYDPQTHQPFTGNQIPDPRLDPIARALLRYIPLPNQPGLVNNFQFQTAVAQNTDNLNARVMRNLNRKDRLSFHLGFQRRDGATAQAFGFQDATSGTGLTTDLTWTRTFSPTLLNSLRVTFNRNRNNTTPYFAFGPDVAAALGIAGTSGNPVNYGPPNLNFTNFGALSDANPLLTRNQGQTLGDSVTVIRGKHSFTFGGQYGRNDLATLTDQNGRGTFNFTGLGTSAFNASGIPQPGSGFDFADFLLGVPQSSSIRYGDSSTYFIQNQWNGYAQDDWKVRSDLTLTLGVRYEYFSPFNEKYGRTANLVIAPGFTSVSVLTPAVINPDYNNFSPRLGLAWKVPGVRRSTVVRAGYGIYYNGQAYNPFALKLAQQPPFAVSNSINTSAADVLTLEQGFVATRPGDITNTYAVDRGFRTPYAQTWNVSVQHDLPSGFFIELGYLGTKGTRLDVQTAPNQGPAADVLARNQLGNAVGFVYDSSVGNSIYHALQTRVQRRFRHGIAMTTLYTFSKSIDDSSTFGGAGNTVAQNWLDLAAERGLSSFDRRHVLTTNWIWTSPFGSNTSRIAPGTLAGRLLAEWQLNGSLTAETGTPLTARVLGNGALLAQTGGIGSGRAEATGAPLAAGGGFFNLAAFAAPPPGYFGNAGRNTIPGPGLVSLNLGFGRAFPLGDTRRRLELRFEANNVLNHVNFVNVNTVVNSLNYGLPVSAGAMRTVTAVLRFRF